MPFFFLLMACAVPAYAYIDPNAGGLLAQILTPLFLVLGIAWTAFRRKIGLLKAATVKWFHSVFRNEQ